MPPYLLTSTLRQKLLTYYFTHPEEKYYCREIASLLGLDPGNLSKELRQLAREGLFREEQKGRIKFYRLNPRYPLYEELRRIIFKTSGVEGELRKLIQKYKGIKLAFIYGSYARAEQGASSDVDLLVVGSVDRMRLTSEIRKLENKLGREINFNLYPEAEFQKKRKEKGTFLAQVAGEKKIILKDNFNE